MTELVSSIAANVIEKLGSLAYQEISLAWGTASDLKKLEDTMSTIQAVLLDAEEKQAENHQLRVWLERLKAVFHDAVDVVDEFECEDLRRQVVKTYGSTGRKVCRFFSFSNPLAFGFKMGHRVKKIRERLDLIAKDRDQFHLKVRHDEKHIVHRETHSFVCDSDAIGRAYDKQKIIDLLMQPGDDGNVSVIPIVGIGGMGKTTLAQSVYNDKMVKIRFYPRVWVCVSVDFNVKKLAKEILKSAGGVISESMSMNEVQASLQSILEKNRFFIVLDDVWNEDRNKWIAMKNLLTEGGQGSKILVTTRSQKVASMMASGPFHHIKANVIEKLGSLAYQEISLAKSWMANGLLQKSNNSNQELEDIGFQYIKELLSRSFFQEVQDHGVFLTFKMHDLLHDLSLYVGQNDYCLIENTHSTSNFEKARHVSILDHNLGVDAMRDFLHKLSDNLRIIIFSCKECTYDEHDFITINESLMETCISRFKYLRVLDLKFSRLEVVPSLISTLKHLRYLDLRGNKKIKRLPNSICNLQNLETLMLAGCEDLEELPRDIRKMISLRYLWITTKQTHLPANGIEYMCSLRNLVFIGCPRLLHFPEGIQRLTALHRLEFTYCESLTSLPRGMKHLTALEILGIWDCEKLILMEGDDYPMRLRRLTIGFLPKLVSLPRGLIPSANTLQFLAIYHCGNLAKLPQWPPNLSLLPKLDILNCPKLLSLPKRMDRRTVLKD
uniref:Disease resistance protein RGA3 n=1 Tax=Quercus lobata TaxID=97700 RepID=A0A7N2KTH9_QUELO